MVKFSQESKLLFDINSPQEMTKDMVAYWLRKLSFDHGRANAVRKYGTT